MKLSVTDLPYLTSTAALLSNLNRLGGICALESASPDHKEGRWSIICAQPFRTIKSQFNKLDQNCINDLLGTLPASESELPFIGGVIGHIEYSKEKIKEENNAIASLYTWAFIIDHKKKLGHLVYWSEISRTSKEELIRLYTLNKEPLRPFVITKSFSPLWNQETYKDKIEKIHEYIVSGDVYQVNLTQKFKASYEGSTLLAYDKLKSLSSSPYLTYFEYEGVSLASASPELFIKVEGDHVYSKPIKGTASRSADSLQDLENIDWLKNSDKDRAENLMITDLLRNDLSINCFNIKVPNLFEIESFETVHHLVSTVTGEINKYTSPFKVFKDAFPGGSITGAPKKRAMEIIDELEDGSRSFYCGSTFYCSVNGNFTSNILIRSFIFNGNEVACWAGGGITIDSTWEAEYAESLDKISRLMGAIEGN